ncbi:MAG: ferrous iron transport protein B [Tissierellia bacterium]|nr:ferrous iron transport protein B [Tissierellia bacterium]
MTINIALVGNPNSGKTTLFNQLTGSHQHVGNWPGVTVEKKTGTYRKDKEVLFTDLPGIYSLSPYSLEELVSRDYLVHERPHVLINVIDASNMERSLYLSTQLADLGIPMVLALNMMDLVEKNGDQINKAKLKEALNCQVVEISALKNRGLDQLIEAAKALAYKPLPRKDLGIFSPQVEAYIQKIEDLLPPSLDESNRWWTALKLFERDEKVLQGLGLDGQVIDQVEAYISQAEEAFDDDSEGIVTDERYNFVSRVREEVLVKGDPGLSLSDRIDRWVTHRVFGLPIFVAIMVMVYRISIDWAEGLPVDLLETYLIDPFSRGLEGVLDSLEVSLALKSLVLDGALAGVAGVLGFLPLIATLFFLISILEDVGYMARIAFILDRVFRRFGLSGKSFIPILIGTGCSVPGIVGTRTIENDKDRRMTITLASMMPCGAKTDIIAMFAGVYGGAFWFAPLWYFGGILAVIISGLILKKTDRFQGDPAPFVMELPDYRVPSMKNVLRATGFRVKAFIVKAGTLILLASMGIWLLENITVAGEFAPFGTGQTDSILAFLGKKVAWLFAPLGFGDWMAAVATVLGLVAKEIVVSTFAVLGQGAGAGNLDGFVASYFTTASMLSFMFYNQFTLPCFAALGAIRQEMADKKWFSFALAYILGFSYTVTFMIYQFARVLVDGQEANLWTGLALLVLGIYLYLIFRKAPHKKTRKGGLSWEMPL